MHILFKGARSGDWPRAMRFSSEPPPKFCRT